VRSLAVALALGGGDSGSGALGATAAPSEADAAAPPAPPRSVDLFSRDALGAAIDHADARADRPAAGLLDEVVGRERARSGQVDPAWRAVERSVDARFHPTFDQVTSRSVGALLVLQLRAGFSHADEVGPSDRHHLDATGSVGDLFELDAMMGKVRSHFAEPLEWRSTEVEVLVDAGGALIDLHVVSRSGRARFDAIALEAVRQVVADRPPRAGSGRTRARFVVEAGAAVTLPQVMTSSDVGGGQPAEVLNLFSLKFDGSTGKVSGYDHPLHKHVSTRVTLSYIAPEN
jgi:TonB family protein